MNNRILQKCLLITWGYFFTTSASACPITHLPEPALRGLPFSVANAHLVSDFAVPKPPTVDDFLSSEIGSDRVLRLILRNHSVIYVTMQGRTDAGLVADKVHFATEMYVAPGGFANWQQPHDLSPSEAIEMLETAPAEYHKEGVHIYSDEPDDRLSIAPQDVISIEWVRLPQSVPPASVDIQKPQRVNPSVFNVWP